MTALELDEACTKANFDDVKRPESFDAIVIGAGAAGGLAAELLCQAGKKVLVLDAGYTPPFLKAPFRRIFTKTVSSIANPNFLPYLPAFLLHHGRRALRLLGRLRQPVQSRCYAWERGPDLFIDDRDCPYTTPPDRPFQWIRTRNIGGRVVIPGHGRLYFRLGENDFKPTDGDSPAWPLTMEELDPWYTLVEKRLKLSGTRDNLPWLPDSVISEMITPTVTQMAFIENVQSRWSGFRAVLGRSAPPADTLLGAARTGNLYLRKGALVREILVKDGTVTGVKFFDQISNCEREVSAPKVILCASALESTRILMLSKDLGTGKSLGANSNALGRYLMDHIMMNVEGTGPILPGGKPQLMKDGRCVYLPRFDSRGKSAPASERGFGVQIYQASLAQNRSYFLAIAFAEMLPRKENHIELNYNRLDRWGIPTLHIDCTFNDKELYRAQDQIKALRELAELADIRIDRIHDKPAAPGHAIHECGTARMGNDPNNSVLDPNNQCWDAKGLYVTDSSSFPSQGSQNPTLTVMALTARACDHAVNNS